MTYVNFKQEFGLESYLVVIRDFKLRKCLSKLRLSSHSLEVELGRHRKVPKEVRICKLCDLNETEDEFHFIMSCPLYLEERIHLLTKLLKYDEQILQGSSRDVFNCLLSTKNENALFSICRFIQICFKKRTEFIGK